MGDTYQAPAFGYLHALREAGNSAVTVPDTLTAATPKSRLLDHQGRRMATRSATGQTRVRVDRGLRVREPVTRLVVPTGHNLAGTRMVMHQDVSGSPWTGGEVEFQPYSLARGSTQLSGRHGFHRGLNVVDFAPVYGRHLQLTLESAPSAHQIGEVWWTRTISPTQGPRYSYEWELLPSIEQIELPSGVSYSLERGVPRRRWRFRQSPISAADLQAYLSLFHTVGVMRDPFVWDPPGVFETQVDAMDSLGSWVASGGLALGPGPDISNKVEGTGSMSAVTAGTGSGGFLRTFATPVDWRRRRLGFFFRTTSRSVWMTATAGAWVQLIGTGGSDRARFDFGTNSITADNDWFQLWVDLETAVPGAISGNVADLSAIKGIIFGVLTTTQTIGFFIDHVVVQNLECAPILAQLAAPPRLVQANPAPKTAGNAYGIELELVEWVN